jgi:hypothetical protein
LTPAKAFQARVWVAPKRNQILQNAFLTKPTARIIPVVPVNEMDQTALILYYKGPGMADTATITKLIQEHVGHIVPHLALVKPNKTQSMKKHGGSAPREREKSGKK